MAEDANVHAKRAAQQSKHAAKNATKAAKLAAEPVAQELKHAATETEEAAARGLTAVEARAMRASERTKDKAKRINTKGLAALSSDTGQGFIALSVALWAGSIAFNRFSKVYNTRGRAIDASPTTNVHYHSIPGGEVA